MANNSLERFIENVRTAWGPLSSGLVSQCRAHLQQLALATPAETWLADLRREASPYHELYRDPEHGFELLAHTEPEGLYRPPHDHGRSWVMYAVQQGRMEMGSYARIADGNGQARLVKRDTTVVQPGQVMVYLPGDIHDTRCINGPALLLRFTERNLKREDKEEHRITRYVLQGDLWTAEAV